MTYGILGPQRSGKSRFAAVLARTLSEKMKIPLYATNNIKESQKILYYDDILKLEKCVFVWDEIDKDLQARNFKKNMERKQDIMHWFTQVGKKDIILIWTTQFDRQLDVICKENTNVKIWTEKIGKMAKYYFINNDNGKIINTIGPIDLSKFNSIYDHKEFMFELDWRGKPKKEGKMPLNTLKFENF